MNFIFMDFQMSNQTPTSIISVVHSLTVDRRMKIVFDAQLSSNVHLASLTYHSNYLQIIKKNSYYLDYSFQILGILTPLVCIFHDEI